MRIAFGFAVKAVGAGAGATHERATRESEVLWRITATKTGVASRTCPDMGSGS